MPSHEGSHHRLRGLPESLAGKKVLDIGTRDGFFAFEAARRGGDVLAVDYCPEDSMGFAAAKRILGARVRFLHSNIYDLLPGELGTFDIVLSDIRMPQVTGLDIKRNVAGRRGY